MAITMVGVIGLATLGTLVFVFGSWPMPTGAGLRLSRGVGEQYSSSFGPRAGFRLGLLRTVLQFVATGSCLAALFLTILDVRWFNLVPTDEMRSLPDRAATMPVPGDWRLSRTDRGVDDDVKVPNAYVLQVYEVPESVALRSWLSAPTWADNPDGRSFGAIQVERCDTGTSCVAHLVPAAGQEPEFFVTADLYGAASGNPEVRVRISYQEYVAPPDLAVSEATLERASLMPVPADWVRFAVDGGGRGVTTSENYEQSFGVPDTFTPADLDAWLASPAWTAPASGPAFGAITLDQPCREREFFPGYVCDVTVTAPPDAEVVESFELSLEPDHTVVIRFRRDW